VANPVDVLGDATSLRYKQALRAVCADSGVDSVLTIVTPQSMTDIKKTAEVIVDARNAFRKPVAASFIGEPVVATGVDVLNEHGLPHMQFPEDGIQAISHASSFFHSLQKKYSNPPDFPAFGDDVHTIVNDLIQNNVQLVNTETVFTLLTKAGIPVVKNAVVQSKLEAEQIGKQIGKTLVFKIISPDISHKTDVGGVILNVSPENAGTAFDQILHNISVNAPLAKTHGVLVSEMVQGDGLEMILGIKREPGLGTLIMIGLGGVYVEILKDTAFRFAPLVKEDIYEMLESLKAKPMLDGFRGSPKRDIECMVDVVLHLSHLAIQIPEIEELDINPFYLNKEGEKGLVLDARIILSRK
jgi:acetyltransferase